MLALDVGDGKVTLTQEKTDLTNDAVMLGGNAIRGVLDLNDENRFSTYIVKGQGIGTDLKSLSDYVSPSGDFDDDITSRYRPTLILSETPTTIKKCQDRANWEARVAAGKSRLSYYKVIGWTQTNGDIWDINKVVTVRDEFMDLQKNMLIYAIDYIRDDEDGEVAGIYLIDKGSYSLDSSRININCKDF
jgi:prophage tail gpP-like protein